MAYNPEFPEILPPVVTHDRAVAIYLSGLGIELSNGRTLAFSENLFVDLLPKEYYDQDGASQSARDDIVVVIRNEIILDPFGSQTRPAKTRGAVSFNIYGGHRDKAQNDAARLFLFFKRRINVQFQVGCLCVHSVNPLNEPILVGIEDNGLAVYQFRLELTSVRKDLT